MACSFLGVISAVRDILKAVDAYLNGEPGVIVDWMGASAAISAISGILAFYAFNAWWSFGITIVLAVITIGLAILTMQELTLPQRLWIHRSVFGRPNHNYYNSEPFGGDKPRSLPNDPAAADEWKDYQRRALNEEAQALGMLVTGITLEVDVIRIVTGNIGMAPDLHPKKTFPTVLVTMSIPENTNGDITLKINAKNMNESSLNEVESDKISFNFTKKGAVLEVLSKNSRYLDKEINVANGNIKKVIRCDTLCSHIFEVEFIFFEEASPYKPIASDKIITRG